MALSFAFDPSKGETPETVAQRRQMSNLIAARMLGTAPKNVGEGINAIGQALIARSMMGDADAAQKAGEASLPDFLKSQITGQPVATPSVSTPMGATSIPAGEIDPRLSSAISSAASSSGVDPAYMTRLALIENGGKVEGGSPLSSAQGPFQFLNGTAKQYGLSNPNDPAASADAAARLTLDNKTALTNALGREPTPGELYLAHQQGAGGAIKLLQNPNAPVDSVIGAEAARNNAATPGMTAGQFANKWGGKFGDIVQTVDPNQKNIIDAQADGPASMAFAGQPSPAMPIPNAAAGNAQTIPIQNATGVQQTTTLAGGGPAQQSAAPQNRFLFKNASDEDLQKALINPFTPANIRAALTQEYKLRADAAQKAADPAHQLDIQAKQLSIKKTQQDLDKPDWEWKPIGRDANGEWSYGYVNSKTREVRDRFNQPIQQQQQPMDDPTAGLNGEDYLKAIPRDRADLARKVANGEIDVASLPNRGNYRMQVLSDAARFDPTFNPSDYKTRLATRKDFTSGKSAQNITSFNTAIGHLDTLDKAIDPLGNRGSSLYNAATAPISEQFDPKYQVALKEFRTAKQAVADELSRAFKGAGGTVHDISEWEKTINAADSPAALHAATKQAVELLHSRINAVGDQYNRGMGKTTDPVSLLSPKARATLERLEGGGDRPQETPAAPQGKTSSGISWSIQ